MDYKGPLYEKSMLFEVPRGAHICHLYEKHSEILEVVVPYILEGIVHKDMCVLVCPKSHHPEVTDALSANCNLLNIEPAHNQIELVESELNAESISHMLQAKYLALQNLGYKGFKISFVYADYKHINILDSRKNVYFCLTSKMPVTVMCSYPIPDRELPSIMEILWRHNFVLSKIGGEWQVSKGYNLPDRPLYFADALNQCALVVDTAGRIIDATGACLDFFECKEITQLGETLEDFAHHYSAKSVTKTITDKIPLSGMYNQRTLRDCWKIVLPGKGPVNLVVNLHKTMWHFVTGDVRILTFQDITTFGRLESLADEVIPIIAHEIKNPLQTLKAANNLIKLSLKKERSDLANYISICDLCIEQITALTENLLTVNYLHNCRSIKTENAIDLTALVTEILKSHAARSHHQLIPLFDKNASFYVIGDRYRIIQIVANLLNNAEKYTPENGHIWIDLQVKDDCAILVVEDDGIGIPTEESAQIFEPFYRSPNAQEQRSGLGLGLYVSKRLANFLGGDLISKSKSERGTIMEFSLPLAHPNT